MLRLSHCKGLDGDALAYIERISSYQSLKKVHLNDCKIDSEDLQSFEVKNPRLNLIF